MNLPTRHLSLILILTRLSNIRATGEERATVVSKSMILCVILAVLILFATVNYRASEFL